MANILDHWRNSCKPWLTTNKKWLKKQQQKLTVQLNRLSVNSLYKQKFEPKKKTRSPSWGFLHLNKGPAEQTVREFSVHDTKSFSTASTINCFLGEKTLADSSVQTHPTDIYFINYNSFSFPFPHELWAYFLSPLIPVFIRRSMQPHQKIEPISLHHNVRAEID